MTELGALMERARQRFAATFPAQCDGVAALVDQVTGSAEAGPVAALTQAVHRLSGYAGTIGFPTVSARAADLEALINGAPAGAFDPSVAQGLVAAMREAFTTDLATPTIWRKPGVAAAAQRAKILVVEDEPDQRALVVACLHDAGYSAVSVTSGDLVLDTARAERPALILLDIAIPSLDGYSVCRLLKADPELAAIPVIFMTARANIEDKLAGLTLGADEFLAKPVDMRELVLRIEILLHPGRARNLPAGPSPSASRELTYDAFLAAAKIETARSAIALAIVRLPAARHDEAAALFAAELRSRDVIGVYGPTRLLVMLPDMTALGARERIEPLVDRLAAGGDGICAGIAMSPGPATRTPEALIGEADEALAGARYLGHKTAIWTERSDRGPALPAAPRTVTVAEDDPDVTRIIDAQLRAGGYTVFLAFDGEQALSALRGRATDVLVLDLMMPKLNGFDVLTQLKEGPGPRPKVIVLSARGREQDVMRAFELGAEDYMTKPFNPQELMARISRLLR